MTAGTQILTYLGIGIIVGFIIGFISREVGGSWGIVVVVALGLVAVISYLTFTERSTDQSASQEEVPAESDAALQANLDVLNVKEDVTLSSDEAREWLDDFMVKQQSDSKS